MSLGLFPRHKVHRVGDLLSFARPWSLGSFSWGVVLIAAAAVPLARAAAVAGIAAAEVKVAARK